MYKEGMKVKINEEGHDRYGSNENNPKGVVGVVLEILPENNWYDVLWPNGEVNAYEDDTLDIVED